VLKFIINEESNLNMTPVMLLCKRGYHVRHDSSLQRKLSVRKQIIEVLMPKGCNRGSDHTMDTKELVNYARWSIISEQTGYNIFHWLAYWNDTESLYYLLNNIDKNAKNFQLMQTAHFHTND
jgi:hypothetical protein